MTKVLAFGAIAVVAALVSIGGLDAAARNWSYIGLLRNGRTSSSAGTAPSLSSNRADALLALREAIAAEDDARAGRIVATRDGHDPLPALVVTTEAEARVKAGNAARARALLALIDDRDDRIADTVQVVFRAAAALDSAGAIDDALRTYARGEARDSAGWWSEGRYRRAVIYERAQRWDEVARVLGGQDARLVAAADRELAQPMQTFDPGGPIWQGCLLMLGEALERLDRMTDAEAAFARTARIVSPRTDWTFNRALVGLVRRERARGAFADAAAPLVRALDAASQQEGSGRRTFELATAGEAVQLVESARAAGSLRALGTAADALVRAQPANASAWFVSGLTAEAACDVEGARAQYARASEARPGSAFLEGRPGSRGAWCGQP